MANVRCVKHGRRVCVWCLMTTFSFPVEHLIWERAPVFAALTKALGL